MLKSRKNSKKQGDVGIGIAIGWFAQHGCTVCIPLTDSQDYDLVVEINSELKKVQVKTTYYKNRGIYQANLRVCGGNKSGNSIKKFQQNFADLIFIVVEDGKKYLIPTNEIKAQSSLSLGKDKDKYIV